MDRTFEDTLGFAEYQRGGDPDAFGASLQTLQVGSGSAVELPESGIALVVGGNNAGKSTLLRQIFQVLTTHYGGLVLTPSVLQGVELSKRGRVPDLLAWLATHLLPVPGTSTGSMPSFNRFGVSVQKETAAQMWTGSAFGGPSELGPLGNAITLLAGARERFAQTTPLPRRSDFTQPPAGPLHRLEDNPALFAELARYSKDVFGVGLTLDPLSGNVMLRFGETDTVVPPVNAITPEYRAAVAALDPVGDQGDGIASALGLLLPLVAGEYPIALVDEPEAFLHPPQAFKLGHALAEVSLQHKSQIVLATHDRNIVAGALSKDDATITVIRLVRSADRVVARQIDAGRLRQVWNSPALRHSNIIDGLFHRAVVIAENERDCVFYSAAIEALQPLPEGLSASDVLFLPSHGLGGVRELASVLEAAAVPTVLAADLDAVVDRARLESIVSAVGGVWDEDIQRAITAATAEFRQPRARLTRAQVAASVSAVLSDAPTTPYSAEDRRQVAAALAQNDPWEPIKRYGLLAFRGDHPAAERLLTLLDAQGVVLAQVGELERFAPSLSVSKGTAWVPAALEARAERSQEAHTFAERLVSAILAAERRVASA